MPHEKSAPDSGQPASPLLSGLTVAGRGFQVYYARQQPRFWAEHVHEELQVTIAFPGAGVDARWHTDSGRTARRHGDREYISVIPPHQPHAIEWHKEADLILFFLTPDFLAHTWADMVGGSLEISDHFLIRDIVLEQLGLSLRAEFRHGLPSMPYLESLAHVLVVHLLRTYATSTAAGRHARDGLSPLKLRRATQHVQDNLGADIPLADLAAAVGLSASHFSRLFKQSTGLTPYQFILQARLEWAKRLLSQERRTIGEVAALTGFADQAHLTRTFRRRYGLTPGTLLK